MNESTSVCWNTCEKCGCLVPEGEQCPFCKEGGKLEKTNRHPYRCKKCGCVFSKEIYNLFCKNNNKSPCGGDIEVL